jgi:hypothetical protein
VEQARIWIGHQNDLQKKVLMAAMVIIAVMILFPPKEVISRNPLIGTNVSQSAGYHFILDDPAGEQRAAAEKVFGKDADSLFGSGIEWGKLLLQLVVVGGAAFAALQMTKRPGLQAT